jgi:hypothetical protein
MESEGCNQLVGGLTGEVLKASVFKKLTLFSVGTTSSSNYKLLKGLDGAINHTGVSAFNVNLELCIFREWLRWLK